MSKTVAVGWEYEVPFEEVQTFRQTNRAELEQYYNAAETTLPDADVARYMVRTAHPTTRYLRSDVTGLGFSLRTA